MADESYCLEGEAEQVKLITESWCRVVDGSGQRHEITAQGSKLVDNGLATVCIKVYEHWEERKGACSGS